MSEYINLRQKSRRAFLKNSAALGTGISLLGLNAPGLIDIPKSEKKLKILILGGTSFLGPHQIAYALKRGHEISTFTRGKTKPKIHPELFKDVEALIGDRQDNLEALKGRKWDVVIDNSGRRVQWTKDTAELLKDNVGMYMYTSSVSVFYPHTGIDFSEERKLVMEIPEVLENEDEKYVYEYGVMKAQSEKATIDAFGKDRSIIVRPHFIVGPGDPTNRFTYWPVRLEQGGEVLVPGKTTDKVQYIDVRDLGGWMIRLLEESVDGTFNAAGPEFGMGVHSFVHGAHSVFNSTIEYVYIDDYEFLETNESIFACPWVLPKGKFEGMMITGNQKAFANGLTCRPLAETIRDTIDWWNSDAVSAEFRSSLKEGERSFWAKEKALIEQWKSK